MMGLTVVSNVSQEDLTCTSCLQSNDYVLTTRWPLSHVAMVMLMNTWDVVGDGTLFSSAMHIK